MQLEYTNGFFYCVDCSFEQRIVPKAAGFIFYSGDASRAKMNVRAEKAGVPPKSWCTDRAELASKLVEYATPTAKSVIQDTLRESHATDSDIEIPVPKGLAYRPFQKAGIAYAIKRKHTLIADDPGLGKAQPLHSKVLTPNGFVTMGSISIGDKVVDPDGGIGEVTGVFPQGIKGIYRITFSDGRTAECCNDHLWRVLTYNDKKRKLQGRVVALKDLGNLRTGFDATNPSGRHSYFLPLVTPFEFDQSDAISLPIDPYLLGVILGDGGISQHSVYITNIDEEILARVNDEVNKIGMVFVNTGDRENQTQTYRINNPGRVGYYKNPLREKLSGLGLMGTKSDTKFIPSIYLTASIEDRLSLLHGLMDTDGDVSKNDKTCIFNTTSELLRDGVVDIVRSLGGIASVSSQVGKYKDENGNLVICKTAYRVNIRMMYPCFSISRKLARWKAPNRCLSFEKIEYIGEMECQCISVNTKRNLYVTDNYVVTHNTIQTSGYLNAMGDAAYPVLILCPASLKLNWERELDKWLVNPVRVQVIKSGSDVIASDAKIVIANYDLSIRRTDNREYHVADVLCTSKWSTLVLDEAHYLKNESAKRTIAILGQRKSKKNKGDTISRPGIVENSGRVLALTGTPIQNKPIEIFPLLHALYPETYSSYWDFAKKYNGAYQEVIGYGRFAKTIWKLGEPNNLGELQEMLRLKCMVRRLKSEVLKELPPKIRQIITLETDDATKKLVLAENEALRGYNERIVEIEAELVRIMAQAEDAKSGGDAEAYNKAKAAYEEIANTMFAKKDIDITTVTKMRVKLAKAKLPYAIEHIDNSLESSKKIVVFAVHHEVIDALMEHYGDCAVKIDGRDSISDRQLAVDRFQNDEKVTVFVGNIKAAGVGLTLTAASHVIFVELDWVPANLVQAEDRCHRMGNRDVVLVQHLVLQGSLDEHFVRVVMEKQNMFDAAMDEEVVKDTSMIPALPADKPKSDGPVRFDDVVLGAHAINLAEIDDPTTVLKSILESIHGIFLSGDRAIGKELMAKDEFSEKDVTTAMMFARRYQAFLTDEQKKKVGI